VMQYFRFFGFSLIGLAINNLVIYLLHGRVKWNFYIVKLIATCVVTFWNFSMNYIFTFQ
jgi:putative flippase GtrA